MDTTRRKRRRAAPRAGALAVAALLVGTSAAQKPLLQANEPIKLDAQSSEVDYKNNTLIFRKVRIRQGDLQLEADAATASGLDFNNSRWNFQGNVRFTMPDGSLNSDSAAVQFAHNQIESAVANGTPASFEQKRPNGVARGRAQRIDYDFIGGTVRLSQDAWLSDGNNEISGRTLVYNMHEQRVLANPADQDNERIHITINPRQPPGSNPRQ
jgi:lipopolysaccharide export system protein LptA